MRCFRHPERVAKRKCFRCKRPICSECQLVKSHHIFCGTQCHTRWLVSLYVSQIEGLVRQSLSLFAKNRKKAFSPLLLTILVIEAGMIINLSRGLEDLPRSPSEGLPHVTAKKLPSPEFLYPEEGETIFREYMRIEGESHGAPMVALWLGSRLQGVSISRDGGFSFPKVKLAEGWNTLRVKSLDSRGRVSHAVRIPVYHRLWAGDLTRGDRRLRRVALTFDGGSQANVTPEILDILKERGVRATMFLTGQYIRRYPDLVKQMVENGYQIGNHTNSHPRLTTFSLDRTQTTLRGVTKKYLQEELKRADQWFHELTGRRMAPFWRAPYGEHNREIRGWAEEVGYRHISWTTGNSWEECMDTLDWVADPESHLYHSSEEIVEKTLGFGKGNPEGKNGTIVLMHLGSERKGDYPHTKLPLIVDSLRAEGYELVTISQLIGFPESLSKK